MTRRALVVVLIGLVLSACGGSSSPSTGPTAAPPSPTPTPSTSTSGAPRPSPTSASASPSTPAPTSTGSADGLPASLLGHVVTRIATARKVAALTFDAGANGDGVGSILATLRREHVPATFFMTGEFATHFPALATQLAAYGPVGAHTVSHPHLPRLTDAQVRAEVSSSRASIVRVTGVDPRPLFRFPYGESDARTVRIVNDLGFVAIGWTYGSPGYLGTSGHVDVATVVARMTAERVPGEILLLHVGSNPDDHTTLDAAALPRIIATLRSAGYSFTSLSVTSRGLSAGS